MPPPEQLLLSDLLSRRVRCDRGLEHGAGQLGWMHPPVHRLLGWASRPSALSQRRCVWRLDQLRELTDTELLVEGDPAETDAATLERLPTLLGAVLLSGSGEPLGRLADAAVELSSGRIRHYLIARSDPRLPGGSRWRLSPDRIVDQRPGEVSTALQGLADLPLAHASVREALLRRSRRWRDQWGEETSRLRDHWQQASGRFEERLEGWLEEPPWDESLRQRPPVRLDQEVWPEDGEEAWDEPATARSRARPSWLDDDDPEVAPVRGGPAARRGRSGWSGAARWDDAADRDGGDQDPWPPAAGGRSRWDDDGPEDAPSPRRRPQAPTDEADDPWV